MEQYKFKKQNNELLQKSSTEKTYLSLGLKGDR